MLQKRIERDGKHSEAPHCLLLSLVLELATEVDAGIKM